MQLLFVPLKMVCSAALSHFRSALPSEEGSLEQISLLGHHENTSSKNRGLRFLLWLSFLLPLCKAAISLGTMVAGMCVCFTKTRNVFIVFIGEGRWQTAVHSCLHWLNIRGCNLTLGSKMVSLHMYIKCNCYTMHACSNAWSVLGFFFFRNLCFLYALPEEFLEQTLRKSALTVPK